MGLSIMPTPNLLAKADRLLELLAENEHMSIATIIEALDEPRTSVYRLLENMQELGWVEAAGLRGHYRLGLKIFRLGSSVARRFDVRQAAKPVLERLHDATGETIFLCIRQGLDAVCIERIDGARVQILELTLGGRMPLHVGAAPRALLAFDEESVWDEYLFRTALTSYTEHSPNTPELVRQSLIADRQNGVAISDEDVTLGVASIGAPVLDRNGQVCAAISISGVRPSILGADRARKEELVRTAAGEISQTLGYVKEEQEVV